MYPGRPSAASPKPIRAPMPSIVDVHGNKSGDAPDRKARGAVCRLAFCGVSESRLPPPGTVVRRTTARVLPVRPDGKVLLLHGWDPLKPEVPYWFTIGGGVEAGESVADAACRELREEVGIVLPVDALGVP